MKSVIARHRIFVMLHIRRSIDRRVAASPSSLDAISLIVFSSGLNSWFRFHIAMLKTIVAAATNNAESVMVSVCRK